MSTKVKKIHIVPNPKSFNIILFNYFQQVVLYDFYVIEPKFTIFKNNVFLILNKIIVYNLKA